MVYGNTPPLAWFRKFRIKWPKLMILAAAVVIIRNVPTGAAWTWLSGCSTNRSLLTAHIGSIVMSGELTAETTNPFLVGFLTVIEDEAGDYQGGYLCIDAFLAPVECRYTTSAVRPTRAQKLLYGQALEPEVLWPVHRWYVARKSGAQAHDSLDGSRSGSEGIGLAGFRLRKLSLDLRETWMAAPLKRSRHLETLCRYWDQLMGPRSRNQFLSNSASR